MKRIFAAFLLFFGFYLFFGVHSAVTSEVLDGQGLVAERCVTCHGMDRIQRRSGQDRAFWESTVDRMLGKRNMLNDAERAAVIDYLVGD